MIADHFGGFFADKSRKFSNGKGFAWEKHPNSRKTKISFLQLICRNLMQDSIEMKWKLPDFFPTFLIKSAGERREPNFPAKIVLTARKSKEKILFLNSKNNI
jgi:hypothetical protein